MPILCCRTWSSCTLIIQPIAIFLLNPSPPASLSFQLSKSCMKTLTFPTFCVLQLYFTLYSPFLQYSLFCNALALHDFEMSHSLVSQDVLQNVIAFLYCDVFQSWSCGTPQLTSLQPHGYLLTSVNVRSFCLVFFFVYVCLAMLSFHLY